MELQVVRSEVIRVLAATQDLVAPVVAGHGRRVAVYASLLAEWLGYTDADQQRLMLAAELHDVGCFPLSVQEMSDLHAFDVVAPEKHCAAGYVLLRSCSLFKDIAAIVLHHHARWDTTMGVDTQGHPIPMDAYIIHLADRIDILAGGVRNVLDVKDHIIRAIDELEGALFHPQVVAAFDAVCVRDSFWLQGMNQHYGVRRRIDVDDVLTGSELLEFVEVLCQLVDFKSRFTATHSAGVAATAAELGKLVGYDDTLHLQLAGKLHDLGKLAVPNEIIEKPGPLDEHERSLMDAHPFYTLTMLAAADGLRRVAHTASLHQEKLNGQGYPFRPPPEEYDTPARILSTSDVFTALAEDRPYRAGMSRSRLLAVMDGMVAEQHLDPDIVSLVREHYGYLDAVRREAQQQAETTYRHFWQQTEAVMAVIR